ncbi:MAG: histidine phosphatase family protein [Nannocystaceae bacterium]
MPIWTFVRHGESIANREGWLAGHFDSPLTERGEAQAIAARQSLPKSRPTRAFCSDLARAHRTAELLLSDDERIPLVITPQLRERALGAWQRRSVAELTEMGDARRRLASWRGRPPGGESLLEVALRFLGWAASVDSPEDTLVVAHGALIRAVLVVVDDRPRDRIDADRPRNCQAIPRDISQGSWEHRLAALRTEATEHRR